MGSITGSGGGSSSLFAQMVAGNCFYVGTGETVLAGAGSVRATFENPAGSGVNCYLYRVVAVQSAGPSFAQLYIDTTNGLPASAAKTPLNMNLALRATNTSSVVFKADTSLATELSGGESTDIDFGYAVDRNVDEISPPICIPPGVVVGLNVGYAGAARGAQLPYWWEQDI